MSAERRKRYRAYIAADPEKELNFFMKDPLQKWKQVGMTSDDDNDDEEGDDVAMKQIVLILPAYKWLPPFAADV